MYYQVYLDSLFIQEIIINFYVLNLCRICLISTATQKRLIASSMFGGGFQVLLFLLPYPDQTILFYIVLFFLFMSGSFFLVRIAFGKGKIKVYIKRIVTYMIFTLITGGTFMGILPRLQIYRCSKVKVLFFLIIGAVIYVGVFIIFKEKREKKYYGQLKIVHQGITLEGRYFMDSGNGLVESISKKPVLLADSKWLFQDFQKEDFFCRPIIYKSVGKKSGILFAYCMDELVIYEDNKAYTYEKVWVGVCREDIFAKGDYKVILPPFYGVHNE